MPKSGSHGLTIYKIEGAQSLTRTAKRENEEGGLSDGAIAGIVIAVVLVVLFILLCVLYITKGHQISQFGAQVKTKVKNYIMMMGTDKKSDPIAPLPKPRIWTCLDDDSKKNIQSNTDINSNEVYRFYNDNMLFYKDDQGTLHNFQTSGLKRPKKLSWSKRLSKRLSKQLSSRSKNGANNDETYTTIIREGKLFPEGERELTLPNSRLQSKVPADKLKEGQWCLAEQV